MKTLVRVIDAVLIAALVLTFVWLLALTFTANHSMRLSSDVDTGLPENNIDLWSVPTWTA